MAEETPNSLTVPPGVPVIGGAKITGAATMLAIMLLGAVLWVYRENEKRNQQFDQLNRRFDRMECKVDIGEFVHSYPKGQIEWSELPSDLYSCVPNFKLK